MKMQAYHQARFIKSVADLSSLPTDAMIEVAFAGRSNAGKSSALNVITQQKKLAHTSKTPGRTQLINFFSIAPEKYLVDLPGYGYAKVSQSIKERWQATLAQYLQTREPLRGLVLLMDSRHPLQALDQTMLDWAIENNLAVHILLTKADKLSKNQAAATLQRVRALVNTHSDLVTVQLFSSLSRQGFEEAITILNKWFELDAPSNEIQETVDH